VVEMLQTPSAGTQASYTFDALTLTVGCVLTAVADFATVSLADATYNLYQSALLINMAT